MKPFRKEENMSRTNAYLVAQIGSSGVGIGAGAKAALEIRITWEPES